MERRIPVTIIGDLAAADRVMNALKASGIYTAEITFRTPCAAQAIALCCERHPDMEIGAGTVTDEKKCEAAIDAGAKFIVSPGLSEKVAALCRRRGVPYYPGCVTPTEIMAALDLGLDVVKFFPASLYGGTKAIKAFASVFPQVKFIPTGGVNAANEAEYLALENVAAVGGTYLVDDALEKYGGRDE